MVRFGTTSTVGPRRWGDLAQAAEAGGFESIWVPEHVIMPVTITGAPNTPHAGEPPVSAATPAFDPWVQIATMAAHTTTLRFGTYVYNIGLRHPFITARSVTTVDNGSGGRLEFGIGASWLSQEWQAMELPFETRGRRVDETIRVIQRLFTEDVVEHDGDFYRFQPVGFVPKPVQRPGPPLHVGGDSRAAMRRAAEFGDGWIPMSQTLDTLPANLAKIQKVRADLGRTGTFQVTMGAQITSVDDARRYEEAGVTRLIVTPYTHPRHATEAFNRFSDDVIAKM